MNNNLLCKTSQSIYNYEIEIGAGILARQAEYLHSLASRVAIITDDTILPLYGKHLQKQLVQSGLDTHLLFFPHGEHHKTRSTKEYLENQLFEKGLGRDTCLIALGGGVVTDIAGYVAATYCRGIPLVLMPTSLLGMVDACIGGKTGINVPYGKNLIGCFYPPKKIVIDISTLKSLPQKEFSNGIVEMIKHALIADVSLFEKMEHIRNHMFLDGFYNSEILAELIAQSCRIKRDIVEEDEKETGKRRLLNFGHTVGHPLELLSQYSMSHGEAVAIGLLVESYLSVDLGMLDLETFNRIRQILLQYGLPLQIPSKYSIDSLIDAMTLDKKSLKGCPRFVMIDGISSPLAFEGNYCTCVNESHLIKALQWMNHDLCCH
jgi:3-dehydroquinate synthase